MTTDPPHPTLVAPPPEPSGQASWLDNVHVIASPPCAEKHGGKPYRAFMEALKTALPSLQLHLTEYAGQATELAKRLAESGASMVVSVGGDGTLCETANGLMGTGCRLGILPMGRGNDYYRAVLAERNEPFDLTPDQVVRRLMSGTEMAIDLGKIYFKGPDGQEQQRFFIANATLGFSAAVCCSVAKTRWAGGASYFLCLFSNLLGWRNMHAEVDVGDAKVSGRMFNINLALGRYYGTGMVAAPRAKVGDGLVDVVCMVDLNPVDVVRYMPNNYSGDFDSVPKITQHTARTVTITAPQPVPVQIDGDYIGTTPCRVEVIPSALKMVV
ncbi:MAG TPA: diacylglycerol kinase family protein [Candidatus Xenobia bacterium]|jgi:YegS/Rv2252/BmrU family lipid kinase